jgi:hypothetical protein
MNNNYVTVEETGLRTAKTSYLWVSAGSSPLELFGMRTHLVICQQNRQQESNGKQASAANIWLE